MCALENCVRQDLRAFAELSLDHYVHSFTLSETFFLKYYSKTLPPPQKKKKTTKKTKVKGLTKSQNKSQT